MRPLPHLLSAVILGWIASGWIGQAARAEPYLAVRQGLKCMACHENPTGGGLRNTFGNVYAQNVLPQYPIKISDDGPWTGAINKYLSVGADLRARGTYTDTPHQKTQDEFALHELRAYLQLNAIPDRLSIHVDQRLAPGTSTNLQAYGQLWFNDRRWYVKAGQMYLPHGLRLEDDTAYIRAVPGVNMTTPDNGVELGLEQGSWSVQLAASNGTAGAPEADHGKQWLVRVENVQAAWRLGGSASFNDSDAGDRSLYGAFAGLRTGPIAWLAEADYVIDKSSARNERKQWVGLMEANWALHAGHNLKLTAEFFDPDTDVREDQQARYSLFWEYTPLPLVQLRVGGRYYDGIPQSDLQNRRLFMAELHAFF